MPPHAVVPPYPSFAFVITEAYIHIRAPQPRPDLPLPSRFHPYTRPPRERYLDEYMTTVDYRYTPPPVPAVFFSPNSEDTMAIEFSARDDASIESYFFALNNLEDAVRDNNKANKLRQLGRRPSLSTLVIDLALLVKEKLKKLKPAGSGASRASQK